MHPQIQAIPTPVMWVSRHKAQFTEFVGISAVPISDGSGLVFVYQTPAPEILGISGKPISFASFHQTITQFPPPESLGVLSKAIANASAFIWINPTSPLSAEILGVSATAISNTAAFIWVNETTNDSLGISAKPSGFASS